MENSIIKDEIIYLIKKEIGENMLGDYNEMYLTDLDVDHIAENLAETLTEKYKIEKEDNMGDKTFIIEIKETLIHRVRVNAKDMNEAVQKVAEAYDEDRITLSYRDLSGCEIEDITQKLIEQNIDLEKYEPLEN